MNPSLENSPLRGGGQGFICTTGAISRDKMPELQIKIINHCFFYGLFKSIDVIWHCIVGSQTSQLMSRYRRLFVGYRLFIVTESVDLRRVHAGAR